MILFEKIYKLHSRSDFPFMNCSVDLCSSYAQISLTIKDTKTSYKWKITLYPFFKHKNCRHGNPSIKQEGSSFVCQLIEHNNFQIKKVYPAHCFNFKSIIILWCSLFSFDHFLLICHFNWLTLLNCR